MAQNKNDQANCRTVTHDITQDLYQDLPKRGLFVVIALYHFYRLFVLFFIVSVIFSFFFAFIDFLDVLFPFLVVVTLFVVVMSLSNHPWDPPFDPQKLAVGPTAKPAMKVILRNYRKLQLQTASGEIIETEPYFKKLKIQTGFATWWHYAWVDSRHEDNYLTIGADFLDGKNPLTSFSCRMIIPFTHDYYISRFDIPSWDVDRHHEITEERSKNPFSGSVPVSLDKNCGMFKKPGFEAWHRNIYEAFKSGKKPKSMDHELQ
ncbi:hypothetical protein RvY_02319 [Ramazzottius varieornatus]|uniref:Uncharacterized protein n=1 Tax=Ramazzottius varieornatus TaxID=947166 RepID=A0A1D1UN29_RAMVA|nr:hypothetical protein RvY_02319 [Ramazzottius varieornatus]